MADYNMKVRNYKNILKHITLTKYCVTIKTYEV